MDQKMQYHIRRHVEVLSQYMSNTSTNHPVLIKMIVRILIKFFKREYFNIALDIWFEIENLKPVVKIEDKIKTLRKLLERKFDMELVDLIIGDVVKYYKIKVTNNAR